MRRKGQRGVCGLEVEDVVLRWVELSRRSEARDAGVVPRRVEHVKVGWSEVQCLAGSSWRHGFTYVFALMHITS